MGTVQQGVDSHNTWIKIWGAGHLLISIPFILILYLVLIKPYRQKLKMQAEIDELREKPRSGTGVDR